MSKVFFRPQMAIVEFSDEIIEMRSDAPVILAAEQTWPKDRSQAVECATCPAGHTSEAGRDQLWSDPKSHIPNGCSEWDLDDDHLMVDDHPHLKYVNCKIL